jgi:hypothetical protein
MILESFKPEAVRVLREQLEQQLAYLENQLAEYDYILMGDLDSDERWMLQELRARRARTAASLRARLVTLTGAHYNDNQTAVWSRTLRVA